jgi:hypothetical protein
MIKPPADRWIDRPSSYASVKSPRSGPARSMTNFDTIIYGYSVRVLAIERTGDVPLMSPKGSKPGSGRGRSSAFASNASDGVPRRADSLAVTPFDLPDGCHEAFYPGMTAVVCVWRHDTRPKIPAAKGVPVRIVA